MLPNLVMSTSLQKGAISEMLADNGNMRIVEKVDVDWNERMPFVLTCEQEP